VSRAGVVESPFASGGPIDVGCSSARDKGGRVITLDYLSEMTVQPGRATHVDVV
jgi:hypothetical protein